MHRLVAVLSLLLLASVSFNVYLLHTQTQSADDVSPRQSPEIARPSEVSDNTAPTDTLTVQPADDTNLFTRLEALLEAGRLAEARDALQRALREDPLNTELLMLEARVVIETESVGSALIHLYDLLDVALSDEQYTWVVAQIDALSIETIQMLREVKSWDILSAFVEPLWQYAPDNRLYILALAEAYAHQLLAAPMENILASMLPEDPDVSRIRGVLIAARRMQQRQASPAEDGLPEQNAQNTPPAPQNSVAVPLRRQGDHFVVATQFDANEMNLMIDTGASTTVLTERAFARLSAGATREFVGQFRINTAGGSLDAPLFRIGEMRLGPFALRDLAVVVLPMEEFRSADGLLGMNVLREFDFRIDQQSAQLYLSP